ncbi:MAG: glutathione S-transferase family protein [Rhodobacteraceae bacterium]|nr:glutathione S-transferase family protein [Paracoccaceae bacterium]
MTIELYCFGESGNAYKAALTMELAEVDWTPVYVDFFGGAARSPEFLALNPMGEVPVMVDGDVTLSQSGVIQDYISSKSGKFGGQSAAERREILRWMFWDNHKMSGQAGSLRFLMNFLPHEKRPQEAITWLSGRVRAALSTLDTALIGRDWLVGGRPTSADLACCGYLFYPEPFGFDRADWPHIDAWLGRIAALPGWKSPYDLMPGSPADRA